MDIMVTSSFPWVRGGWGRERMSHTVDSRKNDPEGALVVGSQGRVDAARIRSIQEGGEGARNCVVVIYRKRVHISE